MLPSEKIFLSVDNPDAKYTYSKIKPRIKLGHGKKGPQSEKNDPRHQMAGYGKIYAPDF